jgi:hypothetical protein
MAAQSLGDVSVGGLVFMLVLGLLLSLWPLAVITNFRGYRDDHASRSMRVAARLKHPLSAERDDGSDSDRRFTNGMQLIVAGAFLVAASALIVLATVQLAGRAM